MSGTGEVEKKFMGEKEISGLQAMGKYLMELRLRKGWSLRKAALQAGLSHATISRLESGKISTLPELTTLKIMAAAYSLPVDLLLQFVASEEIVTNCGSLLPVPPSLGALIREWRVKKGYRREDLSSKTKWLDPELLKQIEENSADVSEQELEDIVSALELSPAEKGELCCLGGVLNATLSSPVREMCVQALNSWQRGPAYAFTVPFWEVFAANRYAAEIFFQQTAPASFIHQFEPSLPLMDMLVNSNSIISTMLSAANCWDEVVSKEAALFKFLTRRFTYNFPYQQFIRRLASSYPFFRDAWRRAEFDLPQNVCYETEVALSTPLEGDGKSSGALRFYCFKLFLPADPRVLITRCFPLGGATRGYIKQLGGGEAKI